MDNISSIGKQSLDISAVNPNPVREKPETTQQPVVGDEFSSQSAPKNRVIDPNLLMQILNEDSTKTEEAAAQAAPSQAQEQKEPAWVVSTGVHNNQPFYVSHPPGWKLVVLPTTALVIPPDDKNACVSFMWFSGMGPKDPQSLIDDAVKYNCMQDYRVLNSTPVQHVQIPGGGSFSSMEQDATFTYKGDRCRNHVSSMINDNANPLFPFWSGSMIWTQAPIEKWDQYKSTFEQIGASLKQGAPPAGVASTPGESGGNVQAASAYIPGGGGINLFGGFAPSPSYTNPGTYNPGYNQGYNQPGMSQGMQSQGFQSPQNFTGNYGMLGANNFPPNW